MQVAGEEEYRGRKVARREGYKYRKRRGIQVAGLEGKS
jgi:hypothetical protein